MQEKIIWEGETVLVAGVYSAEEGGIAPDPDDIMRPFHIVPDGEAVLRRKARNRRAGILVCTGVAAAIIGCYILVIVPRLG